MGSVISCFVKPDPPSNKKTKPRKHTRKQTSPNKPYKNQGNIMAALKNFVNNLSPRSSVDRVRDEETGAAKGSEHSRSTSISSRFGRANGHNHEREVSASDDTTLGKATRRTEEKHLRKEEKQLRLEREREEIEERRKMEDQLADMEEDEETKARYGWVQEAKELLSVPEVIEKKEGDEVTFRARIHHQRDISKHLTFLLFRDQTHSIQGVLQHDTAHFIKWVQRLEPESLVQVTGTLQAPPEPIRSATFENYEIKVHSVHLVNPAHDVTFENYHPPETTHQRLNNRILDLRHPSNQAVFRIRSMITRVFRETLDKQNFIEIQTPKLQPAATESGAEVFKVNYFGRQAFLAQSPQLAKQMTISADFGRVYEVSGDAP